MFAGRSAHTAIQSHTSPDMHTPTYANARLNRDANAGQVVGEQVFVDGRIQFL